MGKALVILTFFLVSIGLQAQDSENVDNGIFNQPKSILIKVTSDSQVHPTQKVWKEEIERYSELRKVNSEKEADLIFEFRIRRLVGEARVSVTVYNSSNNKKLWGSKKYRGTANIFNRMGASLHGIRKCISKGIIPKMENGSF